MSVYNVLEGRNGLSDDTINRITLAFPEVNYNILKVVLLILKVWQKLIYIET
jgi:hypothetical protein